MPVSNTDYKSIISLLCTIILTGFCAWFGFGRDTVTRAEYRNLEDKITSMERQHQEKALMLERISTRLEFAIESIKRVETKIDK